MDYTDYRNIDKKPNQRLSQGRLFNEKEDDATERKLKAANSAAERPADIKKYDSYWDMEWNQTGRSAIMAAVMRRYAKPR